MITIEELNPHNYPVTPEIAANLKELCDKLNQFRTAYGKPMIVTSGLRSAQDQQRINPKAPHSNHLLGLAADIADTDGHLKAYIDANLQLVMDIGLWFEAFDHTPTWCHFQSVPPKSSKRFFVP
ncbi:MAG: hypothetical protein NVS1B10_05780 [Candidatus Saccharimonadales bacterium]